MVSEAVTLPEYDPQKYPFTEVLLKLYDKATAWTAETGYRHRDLFRFAGQNLETKIQIAEQQVKLQRLNSEIAQEKAKLVILKSIKQGRFQG